MKNFLIYISIFLGICLLLLTMINTSAIYPVSDPLEGELPRNLRTMLKINNHHLHPNFQGLNQLRVSGSGQFSEKSFIMMVESFPVSREKLIVIDLRQESHGFINGEPVSWTDGLHNYTNKYKKKFEIESDEYLRLQVAAETKQIVINPLKQSDKLIVSNVKTERAFVEGYGAIYIRLPVTDHNRPTDEIIDQFIELAQQLKPDQWVHLHCRAGKGRTTTFLTLFDIMQNARYVSFEDILARQHILGGADLTQIQKKHEERSRTAKDRLDFLEKFYLYCQQVPDFHISWSQWLKEKQLVLVSN